VYVVVVRELSVNKDVFTKLEGSTILKAVAR
jgi:hypothetical protein